jgi:hypothetical protein
MGYFAVEPMAAWWGETQRTAERVAVVALGLVYYEVAFSVVRVED